MIQTRSWLPAILCAIMLLVNMTEAKITFPVYRLIQMQTAEGRLIGSQSVALNQPSAYHTGNVNRKIAVACSEDLKDRSADNLLEHVKQNNAVGLLMFFHENSTVEIQRLEEKFEMQLTSDNLRFPVYYAFRDDDSSSNVNLYIDELKKQADLVRGTPDVPQVGFRRLFGTGEEFLLSVNRLQSAVINFFNVDVFYGILSSQASSQGEKPIIAVSASYDALSSAPELSTSMANSASHAMAVIAMSKQFAQVMNGDEFGSQKFKFDLAFFLTPTGSLNHQGTTKFIDYMPSSIKDRIELVICLDSLAHMGVEKNNLFVKHSAKQLSQVEKQFLARLDVAGELKGVKVNTEQTKLIDTQSNDFIQHEHHAYADKNIKALTITANNRNYESNFQKYSFRDQKLDLVNLKRNILIISEALLHTVYEFGERKINYFIVKENAAAENSVEESHLEYLSELMNSNARAPHLIQRDSDFSQTLMKLFQHNIPQVKRMGIKINDPMFYQEMQASEGVATASVHVSSFKLLELVVFFGAFAFLFLINIVIKSMGSNVVELENEDNDKKKNK